VLEKCVEFPRKITVVSRVGTPTIPLPIYIERGQVIEIKSDVMADGFLWTYNLPKVNMTLTPSGFRFPDDIDISSNNEASQSFYFNKIGTSRVGLYVYNLLSWQYVEKTVYVESLVGNVPVRLVPEEYARVGEEVTLVISCPATGHQDVTVNTTEQGGTVRCRQETVEYGMKFSLSGEQLILVTTFNNISSSDQTYSLIIQDVVDVLFSVSSSGISPNGSVAVDTSVVFVARSAVSFTPHSELLVSWNVSGRLISTDLLVPDRDIVEISSVSFLFTEVRI
jgi:hypothetical protein